MNEELKNALTKMGYRPLSKKVWCKPVGYHVLTVRMKGKEAVLINNFNGKAKILTWNSTVLDKKDYVESIKCAEANTNLQIQNPSSFEFLSREEFLENICK